MEIVNREHHSSRRHHYQQQLRTQRNNNNESSDIDGTACRVASVTLESDSLSADQPMSFRSKRRKKIPRKEKQHEMDVDEQTSTNQTDQKQEENAKNIPACKLQMDWEGSADNPPSTSAPIKKRCSDIGNTQSDVFSELSDSTSDADADDEQSDWPESSEQRHTSQSSHHHHQSRFLAPNHQVGDAVLSSTMVKQIERFLDDSNQKELLLDQVYRTSAIKQMLRKQLVSVQIVKRGRGTVALKKE